MLGTYHLGFGLCLNSLIVALGVLNVLNGSYINFFQL